MDWAYGLTTVPQRIEDGTLDRTLRSLEAAGFPAPRLFVDGADALPPRYDNFPQSLRNPPLRTFCNWWATAWELLIRSPGADRYAIFQDDFVTYPNLREYLESAQFPRAGYLNLYTFPENVRDRVGWYPSNQRGLGAVALVFDRSGLRKIVQSQHFAERPRTNVPERPNHKFVDGAIVTAANKAGFREYVHNPSLVQHTGDRSSMGNGKHAKANTFRGESFDARAMVGTMPEFPRPLYDPKTRRGRFLFREAIEAFKRLGGKRIVELGAPRDDRQAARDADGWSTTYWAGTGAEVHTVDLSLQALVVTRKLVRQSPAVRYHCMDGVEFVAGFGHPIDLLFLDGPDPDSGGQLFSQRAIDAATLSPRAVILIDDCDFSDDGKGRLAIPRAIEIGFKLVKKDRHALLIRGG